MTHKVLALKFRPQVFLDLLGQEHIVLALSNALNNNRFGHAYLFSGPRGVGKTTTARILAKALNCENGVSGNPCNVCKSCIDITNSASIDVEEIDGASNRGIDEIRELKEKTRYYPLNSRYKIFIIDEVHMLTDQAFNALLKILEEPPDYVIFIFATTELNKIPLTILSRCQRFDFKRISISKTVENFKSILKQEGIDVPENILYKVAKKSEGSMRDGLSILEQVTNLLADKESLKYLDELLGFTDVTFFNTLLNEITNKNFKTITLMLNKLFYDGIDFKDFTRDLIEYLQKLLMLLYIPDNLEIIDETEENISDMLMTAQKAGKFFIQTFLDLSIKNYPMIKTSEFPDIIVKNLIMKVMELTELKSIDEIVSTLKSGELLSTPPDPHRNITIRSVSSQYTLPESPSPEKRSDFKWEDFLKYISHEKPLFYGLLADSTIDRSGNSISINNIKSNLPNQEKFKSEISNYIENFSGHKFNIVLKSSLSDMSFKHKVLQNDSINDILKLFGGKIQDIKEN